MVTEIVYSERWLYNSTQHNNDIVLGKNVVCKFELN